MKKIPTLFQRDPEDRKHVLREVNPDCQWVLDGEGLATRKFDGTCVMRDSVSWWTRREVKPGKPSPPDFRPEQTDETTGKTTGWEPAAASTYTKFIIEAISNWPRGIIPQGTYELCGPRINGNPEGYGRHVLIPHGHEVLDAPRDYDGLAGWMMDTKYEGIVWHHPDGRMAKLKRRDFAA